MDVSEWLVDGELHNGAHFPLCVFTMNARARSAEKAKERAKQINSKGKAKGQGKGSGQEKGKHSAVAAAVAAVPPTPCWPDRHRQNCLRRKRRSMRLYCCTSMRDKDS